MHRNKNDQFIVASRRRRFIPIIVVVVFISITLLFKSIGNSSTRNNADADYLYKNDPTIDLFVYERISYVRADQVEWITQLELEPDRLLGSIQKTNVTKHFSDFDATKLGVKTKMYSVLGRDDILLVFIENKYIPYFKYVEG